MGSTAVAATLPQPPASGLPDIVTKFEIDGNMSGADDWDGVLVSPYGPYTPTSGGASASTGIIDANAGDEYCVVPGGTAQPDPSGFSGSNTVDALTWNIQPINVNKKGDLCSSGVAYEIVQVGGQQHIILYQYWSRSPEGTGDLTIYQLLEGPLAGRADDYILQFDYDANGTGISINALEWNGLQWETAPSGLYYEAAYGQVSAADEEGTFGESAIDLTASGLLPATECVNVTTGAVLTRTGNNQTAQLQDYFVGAPIEINTCNSLEVSKVVTGGTVPEGQTFTYRVDQADGLTVHDDTLVGTVAESETPPTTAAIEAEIGAGQTHTWQNVIAEPDYRVSELTGSLPPGVTLDTVQCTYQDLYEAGWPTKTITLYENGAYTTVGDPAVRTMFPMFPSSTGAAAPSCEITNVVTSLTLHKNLVNDHGGTAELTDFTLTATDGGTEVLNGIDGVTGLVAPGSYTLSETTAAGFAGDYAAGAWSCTGGTLTGDSVAVAAGAEVVCTITNDDRPAELTLLKEVNNSWGGTAIDSDFTLTASGPQDISGSEGDPSVTAAAVAAGTYTIGEDALAGYELDSISCTGGTFDGVDQLSLGNGESATCTIRNEDAPGNLTLIKDVVNDNGGTLDASQWSLSAAGPTTGISGISGATAVTGVDVISGDYTLSETGPAGYDATAWMCTGGAVTDGVVAVANGAEVVCTITNDDVAPQLTLVKQVTNDNGGDAVATDWTLSATGPVTISGATGADAVTDAAVNAGEYTLAESDGPDGYAAGAWSCTGGTLSGNTLTLAL
ncbi:hypothetical protein, partial [Microbacterium sp.]|uniref:hypothetical protein n=1 Tax=Microbacterium sp. TaxID=51671 RepID=UPI003A89F88D